MRIAKPPLPRSSITNFSPTGEIVDQRLAVLVEHLGSLDALEWWGVIASRAAQSSP
jgi:hypothetical protein